MLGPVFHHEMIAAGRKRRYVTMRVACGALLLLILAVTHEVTRGVASIGGQSHLASISYTTQLTGALYTAFIWIALLGVLAITPAVLAGAIASERERRTIEYLFASQLSNAEIVLDKLAARMLIVAQFVLAVGGVLGIFRLLGGLSGSMIAAHFGLLASTTTLVAAMSLSAGIGCERARDAIPRAYRSLFLLIFVPWLLSIPLGLIRVSQNDWLNALCDWTLQPLLLALYWIEPISSFMSYGGLMGGVLGIGIDSWRLAGTIAAQLAVAAVILAISIARVRRVHLQSAGAATRTKRPQNAGPAAARSPYQDRPMLWKEMHSTPKQKRSVLFILLVALIAMAILIPVGVQIFQAITVGGVRFEEVFVPLAMLVVGAGGSLMLLGLGNRAAGTVTYEREKETWVSLLVTTLTGREIVTAKILGNLYAYRWHALTILLVPLFGGVFEPMLVLSTALIALVMLTCGYAASAFGVWMSLRTKSSTAAIGWTTGVLMTIGGLFTPIVFMLFAWSGSAEAALMLGLPASVPYLLMAPVALLEPDNIETQPAIAFVLGLIAYLVLGSMMTAAAINQMRDRPDDETSVRTPPPTPTALPTPNTGVRGPS